MLESENKRDMTKEVLDKLEYAIQLRELVNQQDFETVLKLDKVLIYLLVDWSASERGSRYLVLKTLSDLDVGKAPVFKIDCSDQKKQFFVDWLLEQNENFHRLYFGGNGETLLLKNGKLIDFIRFPFQLGLENVREKMVAWQTY